MNAETTTTFSFAATAHGCGQTGVDHWQDWRKTKVFHSYTTLADLDAWAKQAMGPKASWSDLELSPIEY